MNSFKTLMTASAVAAFALTAAAQSQPTTSTAPPAMASSQMHKGGGSDEMKKSMMAGMDGMQKMQMSGDTDKDFAMMMKMHHQQALEMAHMELQHGKAPEMQAMAKKIIAAQKKEIAEFDSWLGKQK